MKPTHYLSILLVCACLLILAGRPAFAQDPSLANFEKKIEEGRFAEIEREVLDHAIKNPDQPDAFELLGRIRLRQGRLSEAQALFKKSLQLDAGFVRASFGLAETDILAGEFESAASRLSAIEEGNELDDLSKLRLAELSLLLGDCERVFRQVSGFASGLKNGAAVPVRTACLIRAGREKELKDLLASFRGSLSPERREAGLRVTRILLENRLFEAARGIADILHRQKPDEPEATLLLIEAEIYLGELDSAGKRMAGLREEERVGNRLFFVRGLHSAALGKYEEATRDFESYLAGKPGDIPGLRNLIVAALRGGQPSKAFNAAEKLLRLDPTEPEHTYLHGVSALQAGKTNEAESSLSKFLKVRPEDDLGCVAYGLALAAQPDKLETARTQMKKCIEMNPDNIEAHYQLGLAYKTAGETALAITHLEQVIARKDDYAQALRDLGLLYVQNQQEAKARPVLEKAVRLLPEDADTHFQLSRLYNLLGEPELARKHLQIFRELRYQKKDPMD